MTQDSKQKSTHKGGRPRTGTLEFRSGTWHARLTVTVDGESIRRWFDLESDNKAVARRKLARLNVKGDAGSIAAVQAVIAPIETYAELSARVRLQRDPVTADAKSEEGRERLWILPEIGALPVGSIRAEHIAAIYERARAAGKSVSHLRNLRTVLHSRFAVALQEDVIASSPVDRAMMPKVKADTRERAVLNDTELAVYLGWTHPDKHRQLAVLERQTMSAVARMFGGLRTGDLHALKWTGFDAGSNGFTWGTAPRKKTHRPQRITVPEALRPILRDWWERQGRPTMGLLFPALRGKNAGEGEKQGVSHAAAMRRDLQAAFKAYREQHANLPKSVLDEVVPDVDATRWRELFEVTDETFPVDFHSWRRKFVQSLADMGMNAQQAQKLAGHADLGAHERYLRTSSKLLEIPLEALPDLSSGVLPHCWAEPQGPIHESGFISAPPARVERATFGLGRRLPVTNQHDSSQIVNLGGSGDHSENPQNREAWGNTPDRNLPAEFRQKAADRALAAYLETLAGCLAESIEVAA